jgi:hypothetical protein
MFLKKELVEALGKKNSAKIRNEWLDMFGEHTEGVDKIKLAHQTDPELFRKLVKAGVPTEYRWAAWKTLLGVDDLVDTKKYKSLLKEASKFDENTDKLMRQII